MNARFSIETAPGSVGAVSVVRVHAGDADAFFAAAGVRPVETGAAVVRGVFGIDHALVARPDARTVLIMPHGGAAITSAITDRLLALGVARAIEGGPAVERYCESVDAVEAAMLSVLARASSPLATDLLLDQPRRWRGDRDGGLADGAVLGRLVVPPVVAAAGRANIGKSSLLNAVAGDRVALAFDRPGTTRDAVGALVDLNGLVVRWVDTAGLGADGRDPVTAGAVESARRAVASADLVLWCVDACDGVMPEGGDPVRPGMIVATRCDRADPQFEADVRTSAAAGTGLAELARAVRAALVPDAALADPRPWRFWDEGEGPAGA
tara:strand:- start:58227 stop:59198 length:972 start_codon:yes stop_codon:yes gene_type:complete